MGLQFRCITGLNSHRQRADGPPDTGGLQAIEFVDLGQFVDFEFDLVAFPQIERTHLFNLGEVKEDVFPQILGANETDFLFWDNLDHGTNAHGSSTFER